MNRVTTKPTASLSLDLDNQWAYMKTHGDAGWEDFPSYLDLVVPRILRFLGERDLKITFFIVGQDAALEKNREAITSIAEAGHEIGNHSFNHEPWLHLYSRQEIVDEFEKTEAALESITGEVPTGFRGPGFSLSPTVIDVLVERGYEYDCSTLPTYMAPLARAFYFLRSPSMSAEERQKLNKLFGRFSDGFRPLEPHILEASGGRIVEIPVTTFPVVKTPIHASYLHYLATFSHRMANAYWRSALAACRIMGVQPSMLLHPLDFMSADDVAELKFFPGMGQPLGNKLDLMADTLDRFAETFDVVPVGMHAEAARRVHSSATRRGEVTL